MTQQQDWPAPDFPILNSKPQQYIPWSIITPHRERIERRHSQTLTRLSQRGGLTAEELDMHGIPDWRAHAFQRIIRT